MFFANQVITNACATVALLSVVMNIPNADLGNTLANFKEFCKDLDPKARGQSIDGLADIKKAHNSFAHQNNFVFEGEAPATEKDDIYHFICFIPFNKKVYEIDGLQEGPCLVGNIDQDNQDWIQIAKDRILSRINEYTSNEIRFSLLAIIRNRKNQANESITQDQAILAEINKRLGINESLDKSYDLKPYENLIKSLPEDKQQLEKLGNEKKANIIINQAISIEEDEKEEKYKVN